MELAVTHVQDEKQVVHLSQRQDGSELTWPLSAPAKASASRRRLRIDKDQRMISGGIEDEELATGQGQHLSGLEHERLGVVTAHCRDLTEHPVRPEVLRIERRRKICKSRDVEIVGPLHAREYPSSAAVACDVDHGRGYGAQ